ncbi:hypothetical protein THAOC_03053 [Thalassiosira oceanica]|uniref:Amine oxidase domain-containing protein n=1 Tax=Thalassiosira oceanica TaxID=159749 RepID=K0TQ09_THAOC|nr:hypothetical protein THAOC_03053 [Thalassiosira oceanica]|eukprot:EJK75227.1 hypothetical protein THAOC_03053 [Thalassiosira oceanica]
MLNMFPSFYRSKENEPIGTSGVGNDPELENVDDEENGGTGKENDTDVEEVENPDVDDGIFVSVTGCKRQSSVAKAITSAAIGLAIAGTAFASGWGVDVAVQRSRNSPSALGVDKQTQVKALFEEAVVIGAIAEKATEPADQEDEEDEDLLTIEEEEAILDELFMSMHAKGADSSMERANGDDEPMSESTKAKSKKVVKSKKVETKKEAPAETGHPVILTAPASEPDEISVEAVIVGAGWAGISAARDLHNSGYSSLLILEANNYVGGRSKSNNSDGTINATPVDLPSNNVPIEMGSEWLYQTGPGSQYSYLKSGGFLTKVNTNTDSDEWIPLGAGSLTAFYRQTGSSPGKSQLLTEAHANSLENIPWRSYNSFKSSCSSSHKQCKEAYFNSQSLNRLQRQYLNLIIIVGGGLETDLPIYPKSCGRLDYSPPIPVGVGFGNTAAAVAEQLKDKIRLNSKVIEIDTSSTPGKVIVTYEVVNSGSRVRVIANSVAVTVSLNVLKANNINFAKHFAHFEPMIQQGVMNKCAFVWDDEAVAQLFPNKFWIELISDQDATSGRWTTFLNPSDEKGKPTLVGWVVGEDALRMEDQTDDEVKAEMMSNLKLMFPNIPEPDRVVITRWGKEPNVLGTYSHPTVGRDFWYDSYALGNPVGRIVFAGEATARSWHATTVGAWSTGQLAASQMKQYLTADLVVKRSSLPATAAVEEFDESDLSQPGPHSNGIQGYLSQDGPIRK